MQPCRVLSLPEYGEKNEKGMTQTTPLNLVSRKRCASFSSGLVKDTSLLLSRKNRHTVSKCAFGFWKSRSLRNQNSSYIMVVLLN